MYEWLERSITRLQIATIQYSYRFAISLSIIWCDSIVSALQRRNSHGQKQMIERTCKWCNFSVNISRCVGSLWIDNFKKRTMVSQHVICHCISVSNLSIVWFKTHHVSRFLYSTTLNMNRRGTDLVKIDTSKYLNYINFQKCNIFLRITRDISYM
jgi:hypothetical protein